MGLLNENNQRISEEDFQLVQQMLRETITSQIELLQRTKTQGADFYGDEPANSFYDPIISEYTKALNNLDKDCRDAFSKGEDIKVTEFMRKTLNDVAERVAPSLDKDSVCLTDFIMHCNSGFGCVAFDKLMYGDAACLDDKDKEEAYSISTENFVLSDEPYDGMESIAEYNPTSISVKSLTVARSGNSTTLGTDLEEMEAEKQSALNNPNLDEDQKAKRIEMINQRIEDRKKGVFGINTAAEISRIHSVKLYNTEHVSASDLYKAFSDLNVANRPADPKGGKLRGEYVQAGEIRGLATISMPATLYRTMSDIAHYMNIIKETPDPALRKTRAVQLAAYANTMLLSEHVFNDGNGRTCRMFADTILQTFGLPPHTPLPEMQGKVNTLGKTFDHRAISNIMLDGVKKSDATLATLRQSEEQKRQERERAKRGGPKTIKDIEERNKRLTGPVYRFNSEAAEKVNEYEREAAINNRAPSVPFSELMDSVLMFGTELPVDRLPDAYRDVIAKADTFIYSPKTDIGHAEKVRFANMIKSQAQTALAELNTAIEFGDFTEKELKLPGDSTYFPVDTRKIEKNNALLEKEKDYEPVPEPEDYRVLPGDSDIVIGPEAAKELLFKRCDAIPDIKGKLTLLADVHAAANLGIMKPGFDTTLTEALQDHIMLDENGNHRADIADIKQAAAELIADWRIAAYRELKKSGRNDAKWCKEITRSEALTPISYMNDPVERYGIEFEDLKQVSLDYMNTKVSKEEKDDMDRLGLSDTTGVSTARKYALEGQSFKELSGRLPGIVMDEDYIRSLSSMKNGLNSAAGSSDIYRENTELKRIQSSMDTLSKMAALRSASSSHAAATFYSKRTAHRIKNFMENEALDAGWYDKDNEVKKSLMGMLDFTDRDLAESYIKKEAVLKERAENINHGRDRLGDFFDEQSAASRDTMKKLVAESRKDQKQSVAKMAAIIEKRYGLGKEFSLELAKGAKKAIDAAVKAEKDPEASWDSTAALMKDALKNTENRRVKDYRISRKGDSVKADFLPKLRDENLESVLETEKAGNGEQYYGNRIKGLLADPEAFDTMREMFDTKKNSRLFNWNSSEYNDAKDALESFAKERDKLIRMADKCEGRTITKDEEEKLSEQIRKTGLKRDKCIKALDAYISKEGMGEAADKSQAAGYARIMGAKGIIDVFMKSDPRVTNMISQGIEQSVTKDRVKVKNYSDLFKEEYKKAERSGKKDRHRTAAKAVKQRNDKPVL